MILPNSTVCSMTQVFRAKNKANKFSYISALVHVQVGANRQNMCFVFLLQAFWTGIIGALLLVPKKPGILALELIYHQFVATDNCLKNTYLANKFLCSILEAFMSRTKNPTPLVQWWGIFSVVLSCVQNKTKKSNNYQQHRGIKSQQEHNKTQN